MEENKPQSTEDQQGKEAKKIEARFERSLRQLTALMGPDWSKVSKLQRNDIPEIMTRIVEKKKEELFKKFETDYVSLVEEKKKLDKTIAEKKKEMEKIVLDAKKDFLKKVDATLSIINQMDQIEREYYQTLGDAIAEGDQANATDEPLNQ